ncbi:uncharacterized protein LOC123405817 [Hordeum vulgare subsp. vulgare]|uniref:uncharacterized protein LOC123405817 n=1 Tax=Hordeum vulgare subsp. vulgare TaxID=112509 RepID=UPI001D1A34F3|nr:uncharacterized protein LOC123405817 [Hordeum vulgare subsp. vulgare]
MDRRLQCRCHGYNTEEKRITIIANLEAHCKKTRPLDRIDCAGALAGRLSLLNTNVDTRQSCARARSRSQGGAGPFLRHSPATAHPDLHLAFHFPVSRAQKIARSDLARARLVRLNHHPDSRSASIRASSSCFRSMRPRSRNPLQLRWRQPPTLAYASIDRLTPARTTARCSAFIRARGSGALQVFGEFPHREDFAAGVRWPGSGFRGIFMLLGDEIGVRHDHGVTGSSLTGVAVPPFGSAGAAALALRRRSRLSPVPSDHRRSAMKLHRHQPPRQSSISRSATAHVLVIDLTLR